MADGEINRNGATIRIDDNGGVQVEPAPGQEIEYTGTDRGTEAIRDSVSTDALSSDIQSGTDVSDGQFDTTYQNTSGTLRLVNIRVRNTSGSTGLIDIRLVAGDSPSEMGFRDSVKIEVGDQRGASVGAIVADTQYYELQSFAIGEIITWNEADWNAD
ncbi:hypothetical protein HRTV-28_gp38 [Halorubrum tailed virus 28]|uniref:Uncharacterized protein n=1 Tax=Halorubrum tailed virus 28 TaxID=2878009 RepID=A0AAE8XZN4_9CAUD|nr:hypothetical protein M1M39_gp39 [Halorubrum tailed virus 28]UBF23476.1 hypothetical protein HRTV-28_gp38 [Halorubrum tailed virus 28]